MQKIIFKPLYQSLLVLFALVVTPCKANETELIFLDDGYCPFVCDDQDRPGITVELLRALFEPEGYTFKIKLLPFKRAISQVISANSNPETFYFLSGASPDDKVFMQKSLPFIFADVCFFTAHDSQWKYEGMSSKPVKFGLVDQYDYQFINDFLYRPEQKDLLINLVGNHPTQRLLKQLAAGRIEAFVDIQAHARYLIDKHHLNEGIKEVGCMAKGFPIEVSMPKNHALTDKLMSLITSKRKELYQSGAVEAVFKRYSVRYSQPDWDQ